MNATAPQTVLIGTFPNRARAEEYVEELRRAGFRDNEIGIVTPGDEAKHTEAGETALAGALTGGTMGALAGMALVAVGLVPGVAPVLAGGLLAGGLVGRRPGRPRAA
jgi:hypothetical protein